MIYFITVEMIKISVILYLFGRIWWLFFVGVVLHQADIWKGNDEDFEGLGNKREIQSVKHIVLNGIVYQFRICFHLHLFQNAGSIGADSLDAQ